MAACDVTTGALTGWNPNTSGDVYTLAISGNTVYTGGCFSSISNYLRENFAAIDSTTGMPK